jgi:hypothetical protein
MAPRMNTLVLEQALVGLRSQITTASRVPGISNGFVFNNYLFLKTFKITSPREAQVCYALLRCTKKAVHHRCASAGKWRATR